MWGAGSGAAWRFRYDENEIASSAVARFNKTLLLLLLHTSWRRRRRRRLEFDDRTRSGTCRPAIPLPGEEGTSQLDGLERRRRSRVESREADVSRPARESEASWSRRRRSYATPPSVRTNERPKEAGRKGKDGAGESEPSEWAGSPSWRGGRDKAGGDRAAVGPWVRAPWYGRSPHAPCRACPTPSRGSVSGVNRLPAPPQSADGPGPEGFVCACVRAGAGDLDRRGGPPDALRTGRPIGSTTTTTTWELLLPQSSSSSMPLALGSRCICHLERGRACPGSNAKSIMRTAWLRRLVGDPATNGRFFDSN
jgi:hypothetical protein